MAPSHEQLARNARFVFHGTVGSTAPREVRTAPGAQAVTVRVDDVLQGPEKLNSYEGRDVFVILKKGEKVEKGERAVFYANGVAFGETLELESIGHLPAQRTAGLRAAAAPATVLKKRDVQERLESADIVVVGKVAAVRLPPSDRTPRTTARGLAASAAAPERGPITEHDPKWREAVIEVDRVEKGSRNPKQVVVRFPASDDVRWFRSPKFVAGERGVFILQRSEEGAVPAARGRATGAKALAAAKGPDVYTALDAEDKQPPELQEEIGMIVRGAAAAASRSATSARPAVKRKSVRESAAKGRRSSR